MKDIITDVSSSFEVAKLAFYSVFKLANSCGIEVETKVQHEYPIRKLNLVGRRGEPVQVIAIPAKDVQAMEISPTKSTTFRVYFDEPNEMFVAHDVFTRDARDSIDFLVDIIMNCETVEG